ncbi:MAG: FAD binding domain-containing protein [Candidatus Acidiferrales bacterium]
MIPAAFEYHVPRSLDEALRLLDQHGDEAKVLAGGHSLLPLMKLRLAAPRYVVDIGRIKQLDYIREHNGSIAVGALATHAAIESSALLAAKCALLSETAGEIGDVQVRNRGTIGGSLAHADPAADYPAAILALEAELVASSTAGERTIAASDFFVDLLTTQLRPGEMLTEVRVPAIANGAGSKNGARSGAAYAKLHQPASGYALVGAAARVTLAANGAIERAVIGVTGVAAKAYRASAVEKALAGQKPSEKLLAEAVRGAAKGVDVLSDLHASRDYRREMAAVFVRRALEGAIARAAGSRKANGRA